MSDFKFGTFCGCSNYWHRILLFIAIIKYMKDNNELIANANDRPGHNFSTTEKKNTIEMNVKYAL